MIQTQSQQELELRVPTSFPAQKGLLLRVISTTEGFDSLVPVWRALHDEAGVSVFQSFEWLRAWWRQFGESNRSAALHILVCASADETIGIAPFFVEKVTLLGIPVFRRLAFLGRETTDYLDVLVKKDWERPCAESIARHCAENQSLFEIVQLEDSPDRSGVHRLLFEALGAAGFHGRRFINDACPRTVLRSTWESTLESFSGNHRRQLNKRRRQLTEKHAVAFELGTPETVTEDLKEFVDMHQRRWKSVGQKGLFADWRAVRFQEEVSSSFARRGWLVFAFLRVDGKRVAVNYSFHFRDELSYYLNGVGEAGDAVKYSPGLVLHAYCMEEMIRRGVRVYDFLRGTERYKYELGAADVPNWSMIMFSDSARLIGPRFRVAVLSRSLVRRLVREWTVWNHHRREHGLLSRGLLQYSKKSAVRVFTDGVRKAQAPDTPVSLEERSSDASQTE